MTENDNHIYQIYNANSYLDYRNSYKKKYYHKNFHSEQLLFVCDTLWNDDIRMIHWILTHREIHPNLMEIKHKLVRNVIEKQQKLSIIVKSIKELYKKRRTKAQDAVVKMVILYKTNRHVII